MAPYLGESPKQKNRREISEFRQLEQHPCSSSSGHAGEIRRAQGGDKCAAQSRAREAERNAFEIALFVLVLVGAGIISVDAERYMRVREGLVAAIRWATSSHRVPMTVR
jgi:hypothetical protein